MALGSFRGPLVDTGPQMSLRLATIIIWRKWEIVATLKFESYLMKMFNFQEC